MPSCLMVVSHFPPFQSAGVFRTVRIAKYLPELGWDLRVLTLKTDSYLKGSSTSDELLKELPDQIVIHRTTAKHPLQWITAAKGVLAPTRSLTSKKSSSPQPTSSKPSSPKAKPGGSPTGDRTTSAPSRSVIQRSKDAVTLPWMTPDRWVGWLPFAARQGKKILRNDPVDVIYSSGPPWTNHLVAHRLHLATGTPWVADFRDPWLGNNYRPQRQGDDWVGRRHQSLEKQVIQDATLVVVNTGRALEVIRGRYPQLPADKFSVIPNGFDPSSFPSQEEPLPLAGSESERGPLTIVHTGAFYGRRNVDALIHALAELVEEGSIDRDEIRVDLIGAARSGRSNEMDLATQEGVGDVIRVLPRMPHGECLQKMREADVLLLVQTDAPLCIPGKLYEYIAVRKTILTLSADGATADLVRDESLGPCVDPADSEAMKSCLLELVEQYRKDSLPRPSGSAVNRFDGRAMMKDFDHVLRAAAANEDHHDAKGHES